MKDPFMTCWTFHLFCFPNVSSTFGLRFVDVPFALCSVSTGLNDKRHLQVGLSYPLVKHMTQQFKQWTSTHLTFIADAQFQPLKPTNSDCLRLAHLYMDWLFPYPFLSMEGWFWWGSLLGGFTRWDMSTLALSELLQRPSGIAVSNTGRPLQ